MKAVISVLGKDMVGILAKVATYCSDYNVNVEDVTQSIMQDMFAMVMMVDISQISCPFADFSKGLASMGEGLGLAIHTMHEDIFNSMHRI